MKDEITPKPELTLGTYRHYKGNLYQVIELACHSETLEWYVVYQPLYEHKSMPDTWVRPYEMFISEVETGGMKVPRFTLIDN